MNYEQMNDFDINRLVALNRGGYQGRVAHMQHWVKESDKDSCGIFHVERDYCNNPSDAWPIIMENKITIFSPDDTHDNLLWMAELSYFHSFDENPLRAAMIVFIMMREQ